MSERDDSPAPAGLDDIEERAAQVTDYLVTVRGGAPFLSGADGRLLLSWLDQGVPVPAILSAIDQVAERRRRKRVRSRLTITACRRTVDRLLAKEEEEEEEATPSAAGTAVSSPAPRRPAPLAGFRAALAEVEVSTELQPALEALRARLDELADRELHADALGRAAARALTDFHAAAWEAAGARHRELRARAEAQLAPLRTSIPGASWSDMVEEVARDLLRQEFPAVSARRLWDSLDS